MQQFDFYCRRCGKSDRKRFTSKLVSNLLEILAGDIYLDHKMDADGKMNILAGGVTFVKAAIY